MEKLIQDCNLRKRLGSNSRLHVAKFDIRNISAQYQNLYFKYAGRSSFDKIILKIYIHNSLNSFLFVVIISLMIGVRDILHIPINKYLFVMLFMTYFFITNVQSM